jgi:hypothetical protein
MIQQRDIDRYIIPFLKASSNFLHGGGQDKKD